MSYTELFKLEEGGHGSSEKELIVEGKNDGSELDISVNDSTDYFYRRGRTLTRTQAHELQAKIENWLLKTT